MGFVERYWSHGSCYGVHFCPHYESARVDLSIKFPTETPQPTGKITFFRPSKTGMDKTLDIQVNDKNEMIIPTAILKDGLWKVQVDWQANGKKFYKEQNVFIGKVKRSAELQFRIKVN
jgi:nitrogen fixation protein FixH